MAASLATAAVAIAQPAAPAVTDGVKAQRAVGGLDEDAIERQRVEMDVELETGTETLDDRDAAALPMGSPWRRARRR